ncbi:MAG: hypothetical protein RDV41_13280 [Planctomycetota bacterium]|nr:hypothetical protein [Planctomycetota bacterium]
MMRDRHEPPERELYARRRFVARAALVLAALAAFSLPLFGDILELSDGRVIEGKVIETDDSVRIEVEHGALTFPRGMVIRIERRKLPADEYAERAAALDPKDVSGWQKLGFFCKEKRLKSQLRKVAEHILTVDPENAFARAELGYIKHEGKWTTIEEHYRALGFVMYEGQWVTPEERDLTEALKTGKEIDKRTMARAEELLKRMDTPDLVACEECRIALANIEPRFKLRALINALYTKNPAVRQYVISELSAIGDRRAVPVLVEAYMFEQEPLSQLALAGLLRMKEGDPVPILIRGLREQESMVRYRAALLLEQKGDKRATDQLLSALEATFRPGATIIESDNQYAEVIRAQELVRKTGPVTNADRRIDEKVIVDLDTPQPRASGPVVSVEQERAALRRALKKITGIDLGYNFPLWHYVLDKQRNPE